MLFERMSKWVEHCLSEYISTMFCDTTLTGMWLREKAGGGLELDGHHGARLVASFSSMWLSRGGDFERGSVTVGHGGFRGGGLQASVPPQTSICLNIPQAGRCTRLRVRPMPCPIARPPPPPLGATMRRGAPPPAPTRPSAQGLAGTAPRGGGRGTRR